MNFVVDTQKVVDFQMKEPFATLLKTRNVLNGRQEASELELLEPLAHSILEHWDFTVLEDEFGSLEKLFAPDYNVEYAY